MTDSHESARTRVLVLCNDLVGETMAGPGIRAWELAHALAPSCSVTLAAPLSGNPSSPSVELCPLDLTEPATCKALVAQADVVISNGFMLYHFAVLETMDIPWVVDAYIPAPTEGLAQTGHLSKQDRVSAHRNDLLLMRRFFSRADYVLCASERQRDLYLGYLAALGRLTPAAYAADPTMRSLIDVVPFGLASEPPVRTAPASAMAPGMPDDARIILWGGGIWDWLDPLTLIRAVAQLIPQFPDVVAYFPGTRHPDHEHVPDMAMHRRAVTLADRLGLLGPHVIMGEWAPSSQRANYLLNAEIGVSLHQPGIETRFAFRTRILDYIWAGLPMVVAEGDSLAEMVAAKGLGHVVPVGDVAATAEALAALLREPDARSSRHARFAGVAEGLRWDRVAEPLIQFCQCPHRALPFQPPFDRPNAEPVPSSAPEPSPERIALEARITELEALVEAYESGRFMRTMRWVSSVKRRLTERR